MTRWFVRGALAAVLAFSSTAHAAPAPAPERTVVVVLFDGFAPAELDARIDAAAVETAGPCSPVLACPLGAVCSTRLDPGVCNVTCACTTNAEAIAST